MEQFVKYNLKVERGTTMNAKLEKYLNTIDKHLKPLPTSERVDIVKEIKGSILEMEQENLSAEQIIERLGNPKDLAKAYLGDLLANEAGFNRNRFLIVCAFYSVVGFSGMFIIPSLAIIAPVFILCGIIAPILGAIKMIDYMFSLGLPYIEHIGIVLTGVVELNPIEEFAISLIMGVLIYLAGRGAWKLLLCYCRKISKTKRVLSI